MWGSRALIAGAFTVGAALTLAELVHRPDLYRLLFAALIAGNGLVVALRWPRAAAVLVLMYLPFMALARRLLIADAGWTSNDPLLLVGPLIAGFLCARLFLVDRRRFAPDRLSKLVAGLLGLVVLQGLNPSGVGIKTNLAGVLFLGVPLLWFFIGRELCDERMATGVLYWVIGSAVVIALYGLHQTKVGFPSWDQDWIRINGYGALNITADSTRAFGTFSSGAEYGTYLGIAIVAALALALYRRVLFLLPIPLLAVALFLESSRGALLVTIAATIFVLALRTGSGRLALVLSVFAFAAAFGGIAVAGHSLSDSANRSGNALVSHQIGGLSDPLNSQSSTLGTHLDIVQSAFIDGIHHPLGQGAGITTQAAAQAGGGNSKNSETDFTNVLVSLGVLGPILLAGIVVIVLRRAIGRALSWRGAARLAAAALLLMSFGNWMNGGEYAVAAVSWFLIGWATRSEPELGRVAPIGRTGAARAAGPSRSPAMRAAAL